jgi:cytochrome c-type biogenesis protein CcmH
VTLLRRLLLALSLALPLAVVAKEAAPASDDPVLEAKVMRIAAELRCLVCQNQTIADSNATLAQDLRREVREMIAAGKTDDEIRDFMIERYGDFVLYRPRMTAQNLLLWAAPALLLLIAGVVLFRVIRRRGQETDIETEGPEAGRS